LIAAFEAIEQSLLLRLRAFLVIFFLFTSLSCSEVQPTFSIATGGPAGLYYPIGGGMASIWSERLPNVNVKAEVTGGSVTNVIQVARNESDLGIAMADVVNDAYLGQGRFPEALPIRVLFTAYPNIVHILTLEQTGIEDVRQLLGKRVSMGAAGSGTAVAAENVLTSLDVDLSEISPIYLSFSETTSALKDGTIDAGFVVGGLGLAAVTELSVTRDLKLISLTEKQLATVSHRFPSYASYVIPSGTYNGIEERVNGLGIWSAVVVHKDMPSNLAYQLTCTIYDALDELLRVSRVAEAMTISNIRKLTVPLHEGTERYLKDTSQRCNS
jgi:TRAP transporter TAXI family solute receptor